MQILQHANHLRNIKLRLLYLHGVLQLPQKSEKISAIDQLLKQVIVLLVLIAPNKLLNERMIKSLKDSELSLHKKFDFNAVFAVVFRDRFNRNLLIVAKTEVYISVLSTSDGLDYFYCVHIDFFG